MRLLVTAILASCLLAAGPASAVSLLTDDREVFVFALVCDESCVAVGGTQVPSAPFAPFDATVVGAGSAYSASQTSQIGADLILGQGAAAGHIDGDARSTLDIEFEVTTATAIAFDAVLTALGPDFDGDATSLVRLDVVGGANVFQQVACGFCGGVEDVQELHVDTVLSPGVYALSARASSEEFGDNASYDFSLSFSLLPEPSSGPLVAFGAIVALWLERRGRRRTGDG